MASIVKENGRWRAFVAKQGVRRSATFDSKREAQTWAAKMETLIVERQQQSGVPRKKLRDLLLRYIDEVSVTKKTEVKERNRLLAISQMPIGDVWLQDFDSTHVTAWRDERLKTVQPSSVNREWTMLNNACNIAVKEWHWLLKNPMADVRRPKDNPPRERRISQGEIDRLIFVSGWNDGHPADNMVHRVMIAFLFAIETAMRAGEIAGLKWENVDIEKRTAFLPMTKNGTARTVPLSKRAVELLGYLNHDDDLVFNMSSGSMDALFRKMKTKAAIDNLHFHDTRHEAITRLAKKLDVLDLARMVGHKKLNQLLTYYNATAEELAEKLD